MRDLNLVKEKRGCNLTTFRNCEKLSNDKDLIVLENIRSNEVDKNLQHNITMQCLDVAEKANFKTNYEDVYQHLFEGDYYLTFLKMSGEIKGFAVFDCLEIKEDKVLHLHGIITHPHVQKSGNTRKIILDKIKEINPNYLTLKTHNPRMYYVASTVSENNQLTYPNFKEKVPQEIVDIAKQNPFISNCNDNLVVENAYSDEKIQQNVNNDIITKGFNLLGKKDAQVVIVKF